MKDTALTDKVCNLLAALASYEPQRIYLFGSAARQEADELSDLDIVVIKETNAPFFDRLREVSRLIPPKLSPVDVLVYTPEEFATMMRDGNAFTELIAEEGRLIYERSAES